MGIDYETLAAANKYTEDTIIGQGAIKGDKGDPGPKGDPGEGVAAGGTTGQVLVKKSGEDYDAEWSGAIATKEEVNDSLITSYIVFNKPFEFGFINDSTGKDSASIHWARTGFFDYATTVLHLDKLDTVSAAWNVYLYDYDADKQYIGRTQLSQSYDVRHITANITSGHYYRLLVTLNYTTDDPMSVYSHWKITLETAFSNLEMAKSSTVSKVETMTPAEFNSRPSDDNAMTNNVQYNIYENNYMFLHNGKYGGYLSDRNYLSKFAILSDAHIGSSGYSSADESKYISAVESINSLGVDFAIEMGDNIDDGYSYTDKTKFNTEIANHNTVYSNLNTPLFPFGGNHDTGVDKFSHYGTVDFNKVRIIKIHADYCSLTPPEGQTYWSTGIIPESQLTYLENQLSNSKADVNIVVCHYPIATDDTYQTFKWWIRDEFTDANGNTKDGHRDDLIAILNDYNVKVFLNGHEHSQIWDNWGDVGDIKDYNSPNFNTGYTIATVNATSIVFDYYDTATNTLQGTRTISL